MRLSDFTHFTDLDIIKDCEFDFAVKTHSLSNNGKNLIFVLDNKYLSDINMSLVSGIITTHHLLDYFSKKFPNIGLAVSKNPKEIFYKIHISLVENNFYFKRIPSRISPEAFVHPNAIISENNVEIGKNTIIEEGVIIKDNVIIGENCLIQSGTILGNDCFETAIIDNKQRLIPHAGKLIIKNDVVIQSNCSISKGLFPTKNTIIEDEVIIADMVHIAHGVQIKKRTRIAANAVIAGNTIVGKNVWIGPSSTISNGLEIGDNSYITIGATVITNVSSGQKVAGNFAVDFKNYLKFIGKLRSN